MQSKLRPYYPVVRWGTGAFLCTIIDADLDDAGGRLVEIRNALADSHPSAKVEFGIAALGKDDTLETLIDRADAALQETKRVP
jgi:GGDEF domain-containing protein